MEHMDQIIAFSELERFIDQPLRTYSTGMIARLGFSVAVHLEPDILLVDEVLAVGDEAFQEKCLRKMAEFRSQGVTIIFVTHKLTDVEKICDRTMLLMGGRVQQIGNPQEVVREYRKRMAQA
jgi:ABC-type polysaccharide/polyol phosphate transport system ATPase subunit